MITVYVLQLQHGCLYVGQSTVPLSRLAAHEAGKAAAWTRAHPPISLLGTRPAGTTDPKQAEQLENQLTWALMRVHGWQRVRGGFFCAVSEAETRKNLQHHRRLAELAVSRPIEGAAPAPVPTPGPYELEQAVGDPGPRRSTRPWSEIEDALARELYAQGHTAEFIAEICGRSPVAIAARLVRLGVLKHRREVRRGA